jgi:hypothetical protein
MPAALLAAMRSRLRIDLKDDPASRWTDAVLDRHIARTVSEYGLVRPREQRTTLATTNGTRMLDISSLTDLVLIEAIDYPLDKYPRIYVPFMHFADTCELLIDEVPTGQNVRVYWHGAHTLSAVTSTIRIEDEEIILTGAAAYALLEYGQYGVDRLNLGGGDVDSEYHRQGNAYMRRYREMLDDLRRRGGVISARLYTPVESAGGRDVVQGP